MQKLQGFPCAGSQTSTCSAQEVSPSVSTYATSLKCRVCRPTGSNIDTVSVQCSQSDGGVREGPLPAHPPTASTLSLPAMQDVSAVMLHQPSLELLRTGF